MEKKQFLVIAVFAAILALAGGGVYLAEFAGGGDAEEAVATAPLEPLPAAPLPPPPEAELRSFLERPEVASYLERLREVQESKKKTLVADLVIDAAKIAAQLLDTRVAPGQVMPEIPGVHAEFDEMNGAINSGLDLAFVKKLATEHGLREDVEFADFAIGSGQEPLAANSKTPFESGFVPCLRTDAGALAVSVRSVRRTYESLKKTPYVFFFEKEPGQLRFATVEDALLNFRCFCRPKKEVVFDLTALKKEVHGQMLEGTLGDVVAEIEAGGAFGFDGECPLPDAE